MGGYRFSMLSTNDMQGKRSYARTMQTRVQLVAAVSLLAALAFPLLALTTSHGSSGALAAALLLLAVATLHHAPLVLRLLPRALGVARRRRAWRSLLVALRRPDLPGRPRPRAPGLSPAGA